MGLEPAERSARLREAIRLWRGDPLAEVAFEPFAVSEARRLEELRLSALEQLFDAELAAGRSGDLVPELESLVARHPLRERFRGELMLALYGAGRQAEALAAYQEARRMLVEELGLEPGPHLQELHARILRQEVPRPRLAASAEPTAMHRFFASLPPILRERGAPFARTRASCAERFRTSSALSSSGCGAKRLVARARCSCS
ncbi:MAG TPA: AfsR/SARP family transcriptional regulator [Gaiellaceae bacterium]|nr:AfsR/SARP family transcriptional regulator [Gaiellaceae bacterium]